MIGGASSRSSRRIRAGENNLHQRVAEPSHFARRPQHDIAFQPRRFPDTVLAPRDRHHRRPVVAHMFDRRVRRGAFILRRDVGDDGGGAQLEIGEPFDVRPDDHTVVRRRQHVVERIRHVAAGFQNQHRWLGHGESVLVPYSKPVPQRAADLRYA